MMTKSTKTATANSFVKLFDVKDRQMVARIFQLLFSPKPPHQLPNLKYLLSNPRFNFALKGLINGDFLGRDMEWVLVIPLGRYLKNKKHKYELIFGRGQKIDVKDLFLIWDNEKRTTCVANLKSDLNREDVMSLYEAYNLMTEYRLDEGIHPHRRMINYASIENIKECLAVRLKGKNRAVSKANDPSSLLLKPGHLKTELKHLNICINFINGSSLIFLRNVFDSKYSFHQKGSKNSLDYDAYAIVRRFVKGIGIYPERRSGTAERFRISKGDWDVMKDYIQQDKEGGHFIFAMTSTPKKKDKWQYLQALVFRVLGKPVLNPSASLRDKLTSILGQHL